jgi:GrpB-like predicted nucleotidyltransferase (UPF0157 family)
MREMREPVTVIPYDPRWAVAFEQERDAILRALNGLDARVEHIGSTSVPGLVAKPIIDIMVIVPNAEEAVRTITPLIALDYICRGEFEIPGRVYFRKGTPQTHHLHEYWSGNPEIERHLFFRDYLRAHSNARDAYAELKCGLAEKFRHDREAYTNAKTDFITQIDTLARQEFGKA